MPAWSLGKAPRSINQVWIIGNADGNAKKKVPGPGEYGIPKINKIRQESPSWKMGTAKRKELRYGEKIPGPGAYQPKLNVKEL